MNLKNILVVLVVLGVFVLVGLYILRPIPQPVGGASGPTHTELQQFLSGFRAGAETNTEVTARSCTSLANFNFASLASVSSTVTGFSMTGQAVADLCEVSLSSDTSTVAHTLSCNFPTTASTTITLFNGNTAALDLATGTLKVCYTN